MAFRSGDSVEISSNQDGFVGSYYAAKVLKPMGHNQFLVEYETLLTDDESSMLREVVDAIEIRPSPPEIRATEFQLLDEVDAFDNDGWWIGKIIGKNLIGSYRVYFDSTGDCLSYPLNRLRVHQEWESGRWFISKFHRSMRV